MNFLETLLHPDRDDDPERGEIVHAANLLQVGEFQLLQLAFAAWFDREMSDAEGKVIFQEFMIRGQVHAWARHYARKIIALDQQNQLHDDEPHYHRYDRDYFRNPMSNARRRFIVAATIVFGFVGGSLALASYSADCGTMEFPPCFSKKELQQNPRQE